MKIKDIISVNLYNKFIEQNNYVNVLRKSKVIYPSKDNVLRILETEIPKIKVIILGQDPYHGANQANGLAFSVDEKDKLPPSLKNIYKEIEREFHIKMDFTNGDLSCWLKQGVILLNTVLTVESGKPNSHKDLGWSTLTTELITELNHIFNNIVFMFWGSSAKKYNNLIDETKHLVLKSSHPSPFSFYKGFLGNNHFIEANNYLKRNNINQIEWSNKV